MGEEEEFICLDTEDERVESAEDKTRKKTAIRKLENQIRQRDQAPGKVG